VYVTAWLLPITLQFNRICPIGSHRVRQYLIDIAVSTVYVARCGQRLRYVAAVDVSDLERGSGHGILSDWQSVK